MHFMVQRSKQKTIKKDPPHFTAYSISELFPVKNPMIVWAWLGNIFQLPSPQPWPQGSKSVRLFLSVAFPRIPCLSACQHLSCLLTNSGCCFCLPRVSWNRRKKKKKKRKKRSVSTQGSLGVKKETPLNIAVCVFDSILQTRRPTTCAYLWMWGCVRLWGMESAWREAFRRRVNTRPTSLIFQTISCFVHTVATHSLRYFFNL